MQRFLSATDELNLAKALQVSMYDPNVNWAFYNQLQKKVKLNYSVQMMNIGLCGLHVVHGAFMHGVDASKREASTTLLMRSVH